MLSDLCDSSSLPLFFLSSVSTSLSLSTSIPGRSQIIVIAASPRLERRINFQSLRQLLESPWRAAPSPKLNEIAALVTIFRNICTTTVSPYAYNRAKSLSLAPDWPWWLLRNRKIFANSLSRAWSVLGRASFKGNSSFIDDAKTITISEKTSSVHWKFYHETSD